MKKALRLLVTDFCNRHCEGCCNKQFDLTKLPICTSFREYEQILLTGGEPILYGFDKLMSLLKQIKEANPKVETILYTQMPSGFAANAIKLKLLDGITFTVHDNEGIEDFFRVERQIMNLNNHHSLSNVSLRLNIFEGVNEFKPVLNWKTKSDMIWIKNCPIPSNEVFMRLK